MTSDTGHFSLVLFFLLSQTRSWAGRGGACALGKAGGQFNLSSRFFGVQGQVSLCGAARPLGASGLPRTLCGIAQSSDKANFKFSLRVLGSARRGVTEGAAAVRALWGSLSALCIFCLCVACPFLGSGGIQLQKVTSVCSLGPVWRARGPRGKVNSKGPGRPFPGPLGDTGALEPAPIFGQGPGFRCLFPKALRTWIALLRWAARGGRCWERGWPAWASVHTGPEPRLRCPTPSRWPPQPRLPEPGLATGGCGAWRSFQDQGSCASYSSY